MLVISGVYVVICSANWGTVHSTIHIKVIIRAKIKVFYRPLSRLNLTKLLSFGKNLKHLIKNRKWNRSPEDKGENVYTKNRVRSPGGENNLCSGLIYFHSWNKRKGNFLFFWVNKHGFFTKPSQTAGSYWLESLQTAALTSNWAINPAYNFGRKKLLPLKIGAYR